MRYSRKSRSWSFLALVLGGLSAPLIALTWVWVGDPFFPGSSIAAGILVFLFTGLCLGPFLSSFILTIIIPRAHNSSLSLGYACTCWLVALAGAVIGKSLLATVLLPGSLIVWLMGYLGVYVARHFGPMRCRDPMLAPPGEPRCPQCGYVLYYAKGQACPECGRRFTLREIDTRRTEWKDGVLRPWEPGQTV